MSTIVNFYSEKKGEIKKFLDLFYSDNFPLDDNLFWKEEFPNPIDMIDLISCFVDNNNKFSMNVWISLDEDVYICVGEHNLNNIIKYLYERYPY